MIKFCKLCNTETERNKSGGCKPCHAGWHKAYYKVNKDKIKAVEMVWMSANHDKIKAAARAYHEANADKRNAANRAWYKANTKKKKDYDAAWTLANADRIKARRMAYSAANSEKLSAKSKAWRSVNKEAMRACSANRRALKESTTGKHTAKDIKKLFILQKGMCICCRASLNNGYHVDHIYALINGGSNDKYNLQLLCQPCNLSKHAKDPIYFMQSRGFLL
jgi:5-methylcytosine-specific restriction endonuclease McrA